MNPELPRGNLGLILLSILETRPRYGFAIIQAARANRWDFDFKEGSLYPGLHRLEGEGLLAPQDGRGGRNGEPRKYYALTDKGRERRWVKREECSAFTGGVQRLPTSGVSPGACLAATESVGRTRRTRGDAGQSPVFKRHAL
ncbi:PadR family transcriptional regulator [Deinococcus hopiensis]|uniref:DNA-binding transcriptional regulator, PadR family n=1 Tax=Deinococcus hopiensis KR-140 TaxID=695939 RepID=A0A1W1V903_9DEIO|nr:PadR family transcriptional regulator [Deinococcus hopiensis]SMB89937.1 DNA-binding transcriptional regulator, PadR family [Deinococcus hopiensis KR-140]